MRANRWVLSGAAVVGFLLAGSLAGAGGSLPTERPGARIPRNDAKVELGRRLFFDPAVSRSGKNSCASCHDPEHGFSDPQRRSDDDLGFTRRHSQTILDADANPSAHWDGEFKTVEDLATARLGPMTGEGSYGGAPGSRPPPSTPVPVTPEGLDAGIEIGGQRITFALPGIHDVEATLTAGGRYREAMTAAFLDSEATLERMSKAIGAYVRSVRSTLSPFDRYLRGEKTALTASAQRGLALFKGRASCSQCHVVDSKDRWPLLTDFQFHDTGLEWRAGTQVDPGRKNLTGASADERAFKTPTLRDVALRGPYMHDGSLRTLEEVVNYYAKGCTAEPNLDTKIRPFEATDGDVADLVAFLRSMTGEVRPGLAPSAWSRRAARTTLRFVNGVGVAIPEMPVTVEPAGDTLPGDLPLSSPTLHLVTGQDGKISFAPPSRTHVRLVLPGDLVPLGGPFVPDTCTTADIQIPIAGRCTVVVTLPPGVAAPDTILLERGGGPFRPLPFEVPAEITLHVRSADRMPMRRIQVLEVGGHVVAGYEAWVMTGRTNTVSVEVPGWPADRRYPLVDLAVGATVKAEAP